MVVNYKSGNVIGKYFEEAFEKNEVFSFEMDISRACNANCLFCFQGEKKPYKRKEMGLEDYRSFLSDCKKLGGYYIGISGGEPFCNPRALDIIRLSQELGYRVGVITNGQLLNDKLIEELAEMNLSRISISFHGYKRETYSKHFGVDPDMYDLVLNNISKLIKSGCKVGVAYTVTKYNIGEFLDTKKMFVDMGLKESDIKFNLLLHGNIDIRELYPSEAQLEEVINADPRYFQELERYQEYGLCCAAGRCSFAINTYGDVFPCTFFNTAAGNLFNNSIIDIWKDSHLFSILRSLSTDSYSVCKNCEISDKCNLCIIDNVNSTGDIFTPNFDRCRSKSKYMKSIWYEDR